MATRTPTTSRTWSAACLRTRRAVDVAAQVLRADVGMAHHALRLARHEEVLVGRNHGDVFEQARHQGGHTPEPQ